jgi:hypothetical protein
MKFDRRSALFGLFGVFACRCVRAKDGMKLMNPGTKYEVVGPLFAYGVRDDLGKKVVSTINVHVLNFSGPEIAWRRAIPLGTVLTIIGKIPAPSRFLRFLYHDRYSVALDDFVHGEKVPIVMEVYGLLLGEGGDLNPRILRRLNR